MAKYRIYVQEIGENGEFKDLLFSEDQTEKGLAADGFAIYSIIRKTDGDTGASFLHDISEYDLARAFSADEHSSFAAEISANCKIQEEVSHVFDDEDADYATM